MALTTEQKDLILETIATKFNGDIKLFEAWLQRSKLETELMQIDSAIRRAKNGRDKAVDSAEATIQTLEAEKQAKLMEIDNL